MISSTDELIQALREAKGGEVYQLAEGDFDMLTLTDLEVPEPGVTVKGVTDDGLPMTAIHKMKLTGVSHIAFEGLEFTPQPGEAQGKNAQIVRMQPYTAGGGRRRCKKLRYRDCVIHGDFNNSDGVSFSSCDDSGMDHCDLFSCYNACANGDSSGALFTRNRVHNCRRDGFATTGGSDGVYRQNLVHDFHHADGDHSDAFQMWGAARRFLYEFNLVAQGMGRVMQGFFGNDSTGVGWLEDISIVNNLIIGGNWNGISLTCCHRPVIRDNYVLGPADYMPWIRTQESTDPEQAGNVQLYENPADILIPGFRPELWEVVRRLTGAWPQELVQ
jgi:hypothetical protein